LLSVVVNFDEPEVISGALCAIGNLVIDGKNSQDLMELKGIESILNALTRHHDNFSVVDYGCFALCNMSDDMKYKRAIYNANGSHVALKTLNESRFLPEQMVPPLDLLAVLCQVPDCKKEQGRAIIETIDTLLLPAMENSKLFAHLLQVTILVCEDLDEVRDFAVELSFVEKMFQALDTYASDARIVIRSCLVLFTLFWRNESPVMTVHRSRLIQAIISAMGSFKEDLSLQRTSAAMLSDFARTDSKLKSLIIRLGGKKLVHDVLQAVRAEDEDDPEWNALAANISLED
jgi:hypothetical protein